MKLFQTINLIYSRDSKVTPHYGRSEQFLFAFENTHPIKVMTPCPGKSKFEYMGERLYFQKTPLWFERY